MIGDKILSIRFPAKAELFTIPEPEYKSIDENLIAQQSPPVRKPIWSHSFASDGPSYSSPLYRDGTTLRIVLSTFQGIWGMTFSGVSKESSSSPVITHLSTFSNGWSMCMPGLRKAYALFKGKIGVRIGYTWGGEDGASPVEYSVGQPSDVPLYGESLSFDEEVGRFVYLEAEETMIVVDILGRNRA